MKQLYISPELEIICFVAAQNLATEQEDTPQWMSEAPSTSETVDAEIPGSQIPGWKG